MEYVPFGNSGMKVSRFCLGAMTFGGKLDQAAAARVVDEALDAGVNMIDTADSYGASEEVLGNILDPVKREKVFLATKVFMRVCRGGRIGRNSRVNIIDSLHRSLRLLKTDYVDLYQLHHPDPDTPLEETIAALDTLVGEGKIRYVGVSNHYAWQMAAMITLAAARNRERPVSLQSNYNIISRQIEMETVPFLRRFNVALMCYSPLAGGILTGKYQRAAEIPEGFRGKTHRKMRQYLEDPVVQSIVDELETIARDASLTMNQLAILWLKAKPHATAIIVGGSAPEHFSAIYEVQDTTLDPEIVDRIDRLSAPRIYSPFENQPFAAGAPLT